MALAPGRDVREDKGRAALSLAGRRSRGRSAGELRYEDPGQEGRFEISQEINEAPWSAACLRYRQAALLRRGAEGDRCVGSAGNRPLAEQQGGEFTLAVPTTGEGNAPLPAHAKFAEIRRCPFFRAQPFQPGTPLLFTTKLKAQPCRRSRRVASTLIRISSRCLRGTETGSNPSDSTGNLITAGTARIEYDLLGALSGGGSAAVALSVNGTSVFYYDSQSVGSGPDSVGTFEFSIAGSEWTQIVATAIARAAVDDPWPGQTNYSSSDLGHSLRLIGLSLFDENGMDITSQVDVVSSSGFDYVTELEPHDRGGDLAAVPLPATLPLALAAFGLMAVPGRRKHSS